MSSIPMGGFMPQQQQQKQTFPPSSGQQPMQGGYQKQTFPPSGGFGQPQGGFGGQQQGGQQMRPGQNGNPSMADEIKSLQGLGGDAHKQQVQHIQSLLGQYNGQQQRPYMQQLAQQLGGQPPMGQGGMDMDKRPGQPMQGGFNPYQQFPQLAGILGGGGGQFGGQPMQGGFGRPLAGEPMGGQQPLPQVFQDFMNQQKQGGQPFGIADGGPSMDPQSPQYAQAMQRFNAMQGQQVGNTGQMVGPMGGQFGGQPMQGGFNPQQMGIQQMLNTVPQQAGQQFGGQQLGGGGGQFGGQPMSQTQRMLGHITPQQMQLMSFPQPGQGGQFGGQPMQGGAQAPMSPLRQDPNADDPQRQPRMQNMQNMQQQGSQRGQTMPQAPTTQQMGQENPRMAAMRNMQQMRFGAR